MKILSATFVASVFAMGSLFVTACGSGNNSTAAVVPVTSNIATNCSPGQMTSPQGILVPSPQCNSSANMGVLQNNPNSGCIQGTPCQSNGINGQYGNAPYGINSPYGNTGYGNGFNNGYNNSGGFYISVGGGYGGNVDPRCPRGGYVSYYTSPYTWWCSY